MELHEPFGSRAAGAELGRGASDIRADRRLRHQLVRSRQCLRVDGTSDPPPYDTLDLFLVPRAPYARGGHHFSNGATWVEQFASPLGLTENVRPAFQGSSVKATNYAVGGARA